MKTRIYILAILATLAVLPLSGQNTNMERLNAYKIAFFTKRLNLTPREAEKFWPVYNEYQDRKNKIHLERQEINRNFNQNELNMTDREMSEAGDKLAGLEVREASLAQEFHNKIKTILSPAKVLRLYQAENQYRLQLLKELQERREVRNPNLRQRQN
jgi:Rps23 Pro-64 3,4-dihydroxylase Tpa1-like proline 4-hydroxylase